MIVGAGLSASAGSILILFNEIPLIAVVGVASALGILGQAALEAIAQRLIGSQRREPESR
ncbi:phage holin family protein (plasmid) [Burkholderia lata]